MRSPELLQKYEAPQDSQYDQTDVYQVCQIKFSLGQIASYRDICSIFQLLQGNVLYIISIKRNLGLLYFWMSLILAQNQFMTLLMSINLWLLVLLVLTTEYL